jgi:hypothetical protein
MTAPAARAPAFATRSSVAVGGTPDGGAGPDGLRRRLVAEPRSIAVPVSRVNASGETRSNPD